MIGMFSRMNDRVLRTFEPAFYLRKRVCYEHLDCSRAQFLCWTGWMLSLLHHQSNSIKPFKSLYSKPFFA
jgi:hypothetical protein